MPQNPSSARRKTPRPHGRAARLTHGSLLAKNTALNLAGYGLPLVTAVFTIPFIIKGLGYDRFGILTLAWFVISYLSLLDLGLNRALTQMVSSHLGKGKDDQIPALISTALFLTALLGVGVGGVCALAVPWAVQVALNVPPNLVDETIRCFFLLCGFLPFLLVSVGLRGVLDAHQRFDLTNMVRIPMGIFGFLAPALVLPFSSNLFHILLVLVGGRFFALVVQWILCVKFIPGFVPAWRFQSRLAKGLVRMGGWMTVSNLANPLLVHGDRFIIAAMVSMTAVSYYATSQEIVTKIWLIPGAFMGVLFPAFSSSFVMDREKSALLFEKGTSYLFLILFPLILSVITFAQKGLGLWVGQDFAAQGHFLLQWMAAGAFMAGLGQVPYALIQGGGRPDITARIHFAEVFIYFPLVWFMVACLGVTGAAVAWFARLFVESLVLFFLAGRMVPEIRFPFFSRLIFLGSAFIFFILGAMLDHWLAQMGFVACVWVGTGLFFWRFVLSVPEKKAILGWMGRPS